jgi:hypothetical protein
MRNRYQTPISSDWIFYDNVSDCAERLTLWLREGELYSGPERSSNPSDTRLRVPADVELGGRRRAPALRAEALV